LKISTLSPNESNSSLIGSCYSFQSIDTPNSNSILPTTNTNTAKRRLQPRTNPNYINVDFINTKNGSLIKNTYIKLQDLTNNSENSPSENTIANKLDESISSTTATTTTTTANNKSAQISTGSKSSFSTVSQAVLLLISLLNNTASRTLEKKSKTVRTSTRLEKSISSEVANVDLNSISNINNKKSSTVCSINNVKLSFEHQANLSLGSSSVTLISENSEFTNNTNNINTDLSLLNSSTMSRLGNEKKKIVSVQSAMDMGNLKKGPNGYSASLTKKNLEKNNVILKTEFTNSEFIDRYNSNINSPVVQPNSSSKPTVFSLFKRNNQAKYESEHSTPQTPNNYIHIEYNQNYSTSPKQPQTGKLSTKFNRKNSFSKELFTTSSSSSLADIRNISESASCHAQTPQFNNRLQTFKRSFNKKTSFKKIKSPDVVFNSNNNENNEVKFLKRFKIFLCAFVNF